MLRDTMIRGIASGTLIWKGPWVDSSAYVVNDLVENNGSSYIATSDHISSPVTEPGDGTSWTTVWDLVAAKGADGTDGVDGLNGLDGVSFIWRGQWSDSSSYIINDVVYNSGSSYISTADHNASFPTEPGDGTSWTTVWDLMAQKGDDGDQGPQGPDGPQGDPGPQGPAGQDGVFDRCDQLILEMEMEFKTSFLCNYKEFAYSAQKLLIDVDIYTDATANVKLFHKDLTYNAQKQLIQTDLTRISDGALLTSIFSYDAQKNLISIERSGYCSCSSSSSSSRSSSSSSRSSSSSSCSSSSSRSSISSSSSSAAIPEGARITDDGEIRITDDGETRIID
ncbi:MAG: hypothetical protein GOV02_03115 [Candidatus Aenigmarchaeota archaeon]|nr:hypothetical protein [Candidatus Aenigmarchaeota archaeon]